MRGAHLLGRRELRFDRVNGDDHAGAADARALDGAQANASAAKHRDGRAGLDARCVQHGAHSGRDSAADERQAVKGDIFAHLHDRMFVQQHLFGVAAEVGELADGAAVPGEARFFVGAATQFGGAAEVGTPANAHFALPAEHGKAADHVVARLHVADLVTDGFDDAGWLVAENRGRGQRVEAVNEVQVAVADTRRHGLDEYLVALRLVDVDILDGQGLVRPVEDGGFHWILLSGIAVRMIRVGAARCAGKSGRVPE